VARADGTDVYTPAVTTDFVMAFTRNTMSMNLARPVTEAELAGFRLHGVTPGQIIPELGRARDWQARVFACHHSVPCVGYAFSQRKKVRKQEYQSRSPAEMKVLRAQGVEFEEWRAEPRFVYVGDTSIGVFESEPWLFDYPIIIVECTFLEPTLDGVDLAARCERDGHIYFAGALEHVVRAHPSLMFVLIHFSLRYEIDEITAFFRRFPDLPNIRLHVGSMSDLTSHHLESDDPLLSSTLGHTKPCP
jgi:ribonuclease Z